MCSCISLDAKGALLRLGCYNSCSEMQFHGYQLSVESRVTGGCEPRSTVV